MKQLAELYINTNSTSTCYGIKAHGSYGEACQYLQEMGFEFGSEGRSNSGGVVERWWKENQVAQPVVTHLSGLALDLWTMPEGGEETPAPVAKPIKTCKCGATIPAHWKNCWECYENAIAPEDHGFIQEVMN